MADRTKTPARTGRRDATWNFAADHKKVGRIFAGCDEVRDKDGAHMAQLMGECGIGPEKISPATKRQGSAPRLNA